MLKITELMQGIENCECGKQHLCPMDHVIIGAGVLPSLVDICRNYQSILLVSDQNTWQACGWQVAEILGEKITGEVRFETGSDVLIPDETAIEQIREKVTDSVDLILGVGSGVINDLCKYVSFGQGLPYYIVATALSMDGYVSVGAALILKGMKVTINTAPPKAILADTKVLKDAPMDMLKAGYGDIVGKYSCLNDWKLSALINGEYFCQRVYDITYEMAERVRELASGICEREEKAVSTLMEALVIVGIAMSYVGSSRPASGSEHHLAHFFEIHGILHGLPYYAHGLDVAYSSVLTARIREQILASTPKKRAFDKEEWMREIERIYLSSAEEVIALQEGLGRYYQDNEADILEKWDAIRALLAEAPGEQEMQEMIAAVGLNYQEFEEFYGSSKLADALLYAKDLKDRYSVLWLYYQFFR